MKARVMTGQGARQGLAAFGVAALLATTAPAGWAQDVSSREGIALQNQILALRQEVEQAQSSRGGDGSAPAAARVETWSPSFWSVSACWNSSSATCAAKSIN